MTLQSPLSAQPSLQPTMAPKNGIAEEPLPVGVGRVPQWWMEITPHYTLDLEEDQQRREMEAKMSVFFAHMAAAEDAGMLGPDGVPVGGWNSSGWQGRGSWGGRSGGADGEGGDEGPTGRNFKIGNLPPFDPKLFGIREDDPDYQAYLTGAKLPPAFLEMMEKYRRGDTDWASNLKQTDYGRYGRQAEKPEFKPAWMKKKLRSTQHGSQIRKGVYSDGVSSSPRREDLRRIQADSQGLPAAPVHDEDIDEQEPELQDEVEPESEPEEQETEEEDESKSEFVPATFSTPERPPTNYKPEPEAPKTTYKKYNFNDYYYNAPKTAPEPEPQEKEEENDEEYEEEYEDAEEEEYEEDAPAQPSLEDLQAILAAKQAELRRLQGM